MSKISQDYKGILWMIISMAAFAIEDSLIKALSQYIPTGEILILFGFAGAAAFAIIARLQRTPLFLLDAISPQ